ncbi:hypothetical protein [Arthrobacter sp. D3-16]
MANKETLKSRARIAAKFSILMRQQDFLAAPAKNLPTDSNGEYTVIVAADFESAVVTIHRMETVGERHATLVTEIDGKLTITTFEGHYRASASHESVDVPGGLTVREWLSNARSSKGKMYSASGSEFEAEISSLVLENA